MLKHNQIVALCEATEKFVVETLCPMVEEFTGEKSGENFKSNLYAALRTVATNIRTGQLKFAKSGGKFVILDTDKPKEEKASEEEGEKLGDMAAEMEEPINKIVKIAKKHAEDKDDFDSSLAATALTITQHGGKGALIGLLIGLHGIVSGEIEI